LAVPGLAWAELFTGNSRLDHALWPEHDPKLVVSGEIGLIDEDGVMRFRINRVIFGDNSLQGQGLKISVKNFIWPETLVSSQKGAFCILVLQPWNLNGYEWYLDTVVPGRKKDYPRARDTQAARAVLAEELLAQLKTEKSETRQRALLLQLAPVLAKDKAKA